MRSGVTRRIARAEMLHWWTAAAPDTSSSPEASSFSRPSSLPLPPNGSLLIEGLKPTGRFGAPSATDKAGSYSSMQILFLQNVLTLESTMRSTNTLSSKVDGATAEIRAFPTPWSASKTLISRLYVQYRMSHTVQEIQVKVKLKKGLV